MVKAKRRVDRKKANCFNQKTPIEADRGVLCKREGVGGRAKLDFIVQWIFGEMV